MADKLDDQRKKRKMRRKGESIIRINGNIGRKEKKTGGEKRTPRRRERGD